MAKKVVSSSYNRIFNSLINLNQEEIDSVLTIISELKKISQSKENQIPCSIFNKNLSSYESLVKYFRENLKFSNKEISRILKKNPGTIAVVYKNAREKQHAPLDTTSEYYISLDIFSEEKSVFEAILIALRHQNLSYHEISAITKRNYKTVWSVINRKK